MKEKIQEDMKEAMRARDSQRLGVIRLMLAAIKQREVDERIVLDDSEIFAILNKMLKQRRDSAEQYIAANRSDLADQENFEITIIQTYLPEQLSSAEVERLIQDAVKEVNASNMQDMGKVMAILKPKIQGRADVGSVSQAVKQLLASS